MELWNLDIFSDSKNIFAIVNNKKYELNSDIFLVSEILKEIFRGNRFIESTNQIKEIEDVSTETWELFLNFVYSSYIKKFLQYITNIDVETLNLDTVDTYNLLDLIIFADKIIATKIVRIISDYLFNKFFNNNLSNISEGKDLDSYGLYEDIFSVIDPSSIYFSKNNRNLLFVYHIDYNELINNSTRQEFNIDKLLPYPHLLYYLLVYISHIKIRYNRNTVKLNIIFKGNDIDSRYLGDNDILDILFYMNLKKPSTQMYHKYPYFNSYDIASLNTILMYILYPYTHKENANLDTLLEENWRIKGDTLIHDLISQTLPRSSFLNKSKHQDDENSDDGNSHDENSDNSEDNEDNNENSDSENEDNDDSENEDSDDSENEDSDNEDRDSDVDEDNEENNYS